MIDDATITNKDLWNAWTKFHESSKFYDLDGFKKGVCSLKHIELEELGQVKGKTMLHLQCHFGMDTLSWARLGADVTGVDFAQNAINLAQSLSLELDQKSEFVCCDIYSLPQVLHRKFDIVFTSYGVLPWLRDITGWAQIVSNFLKSGGIFYIVEFHPILGVINDDGKFSTYSYFYKPEADISQVYGSYADVHIDFKHKAYEWSHCLGDIVTSLIQAGLSIEFLHEFPYSVYKVLPCVDEFESGHYYIEGLKDTIPLMFSIRAKK